MLERQGKNWWRTGRLILQQTRILKGDLQLLGVAQTAADWRMVVLNTFVSLVVMASKAPLASMTPNWNVMVPLLLETASTHKTGNQGDVRDSCDDFDDVDGRDGAAGFDGMDGFDGFGDCSELENLEQRDDVESEVLTETRWNTNRGEIIVVCEL